MKLLNIQQFHRLSTHEDAAYFHFHKGVGFLILGHFIWRIMTWIIYGDMYFTDDFYTLAWIIIHAVLHITSFQFNIQTRRNKTYNVIWPEMRWHTMLFAYRSILAMLIQWHANKGYLPNYVADYSKGIIVLGTIFLADSVTQYYKRKNLLENKDSTMRGNPYPSCTPQWYINLHNLFYSISQVLATLNVLCHKDMGKLFLILLPIQTAPFCMTLVKKGIIDQAGWHMYYTLALLMNYVYCTVREYPPIIPCKIYWGMAVLFSILRFGANTNKYVLWIPLVIIQMYYVNGGMLFISNST